LNCPNSNDMGVRILRYMQSYENGVLLKTTTTQNSNFDSFGNTKTIISTITDETTGDVFTKTANNTYTNDTSSWILARLTNAEVIDEAYGDTQTKTSSFTYDTQTGILKTEIIEPTNTKWLKKSYTYDRYGNKIKELVSGADITSRSTTTTYDPLGKFALKVTNALGHTQTNEYNQDGQVLKVTSPNGLVTSFLYDSFGKKIQETRPDGTTTIYDYNFDNSIANSYYTITVKSDGSPSVTTYFSKLNQELRTVNIGFGGSKIYEDTFYDAIGNVKRKSSPYTDTEPAEYTYLTYDKYQRVKTIDMPAPNNQRATSTNAYDKYTLINTNAKGQEKSTTKNVLGKIVKVQEEENAYELYAYDAGSNLVKTTDTQGNEIVLKYDIFGNKTQQNDPDMGEWDYTYTALGQLKTQTDSKGQTTSMTYDILGRKTSQNIAGVVSTWQYDTTKKGRLHKESKPNFIKEYSYDEFLRLKSATTTTDNKTFKKSYTYDAYGRLDTKTLPKNFIVKNVYNDYGYLSAIKSPKEQIKDFDPEHFVSLIENTLDDAIDSYAKSLEYKEKAKQLTAKAAYYTQIAARYSSYKDMYLNYAKQLRTHAARYEYYGQKYKHQAAYYKSVANNYMSLANRYANWWGGWASRYFTRLADKYNWYSARYAYYSSMYLKIAQHYENRASLYENYANSDSSWMARGENYYLNLAKNAVSQSKEALAIAENYSQRSEDGYEVNKAYQVILDDTEYNYFYKVLRQDSYSRVTKYISGNGLITTKEYDTSGVLNTIKTGYNFNDAIRELNFEYDLVANVTSREDKKLQVIQAYEYDNLNRVVSASSTTQDDFIQLSYDYDTIGNMTYKSDIGSYSYTGNSPHQVTGAGNKGFTYDLNGNMINNNGTFIEYTAFNKVAKLKTPTDTINFSYDTNHNRYKKSTDKYTSYYIDKSYEKKINKDNSEEDKYFIYVDSKVMSIYTSSLNETSTKYLHYDSLNSVDTITNNQGVVESRMAYKPFGEKLNLDKDGKKTQTPPKTKRGYTGHEHIEETHFINMNARLYDPTIARFLSADSIIPYMYDTQSFNRYSYVRNNPLKYIDPSGHWGISSIGSAISNAWKDAGSSVSNAWKDVGETLHQYRYKIGGAILIVVGAIGLTPWGQALGGLYWGPVLMATGASMIDYNPNEEESERNQIYIGSGGNSGVPDFTVVEWGEDSQGRVEQQQRINDLIDRTRQGTKNKLLNGAGTSSYNVTVGNYNNPSSSNPGDNVLGIDKADNTYTKPSGFTRIVSGLGAGLSKIGSQKSRIGNGVVRGFEGLLNGLPRMWNNTPWYAKGLLVHSGGIFATPAMEVGAGYAYYYPGETAIAIETLDGYYGGSSPGNNYGSFVAGFENITGVELVPSVLKP
uniref:RHS repeat domain-containing protein n=1 Tax=uncultured Sulfurimonas sp. TaxID=291845 RepID=UPI0032B2DA7D